MKKFLAIVLAVVMIASVAMLAGCGGAKEADKDASKPTLTMATNAYFAPYEFYEGEDIVGIDVEIARAIADKLGMELKVVDIEFDSIITGVQTGKYDMGMAGMTVTDERKESVDFSDSYATGIQSVIVKEDSAIKTVDDILDVIGDEKQLGKKTGMDSENQKATYPAVHGLDASKKRLKELTDTAVDALSCYYDNAELFTSLARKLEVRVK